MAKKIKRKKATRSNPQLRVRDIGRAMVIDYERGGEEFRHRFGKGVGLFVDTTDDGCIVIKGGDMHVDERGFIHG